MDDKLVIVVAALGCVGIECAYVCVLGLVEALVIRLIVLKSFGCDFKWQLRSNRRKVAKVSQCSRPEGGHLYLLLLIPFLLLLLFVLLLL